MNEISVRLLDWYALNCRQLPWRDTRDPYFIWISEIILQQTRVAQGYDYFVRFVERFPTVKSLAEASEDDVMRMWQGLGYYSRARNLHMAAKQIYSLGKFPSSYEEIRLLKGVGDYTAAAIASFAFDIPKAAVDGNVSRVWARVLGIDEAIDSARGKKMIAEAAQMLLPVNYAAKYNQAAMEFGALQCVPRNPDCTKCPLADMCVALAEGRVQELPIKSLKAKVAPRYFSYLYIHNSTNILLHKRTANDIWLNLYELPLIETDKAMQTDDLLVSREFFAWHSLMSHYMLVSHVERVKHVLTHRVLHISFYELVVQGELLCPQGYVCVPFDELGHYALPRPIERYLINKKCIQ